jgi:hypothetical protein
MGSSSFLAADHCPISSNIAENQLHVLIVATFFCKVFLSLRFDDDLGKDDTEEEKGKPKKNKRRQNQEVPKQLPVSDNKKAKQELISKAREEVDAELRSVSFTLDPKERRRIQKEALSALFETYFRILKHSMSISNSRYVHFNVVTLVFAITISLLALYHSSLSNMINFHLLWNKVTMLTVIISSSGARSLMSPQMAHTHYLLHVWRV